MLFADTEPFLLLEKQINVLLLEREGVRR